MKGSLCRVLSFLLLSLVLTSCGGGGGGGDTSGSGGAPIATVSAASSVTQTGATLNGTVTPNGLATQAWFEYGTDTSLSTYASTAMRSVSDGLSAMPVMQAVSGCTEGTVYYFRVCGTNSKGTTKSAITSFATSSPGLPPTVTTLATTSVAATGATVNGNVTPNGLSTTAWFEWGTDPSLATYSTTPAQSVGAGMTSMQVNAALSGLSTGTTYYVRVAASNGSGLSKGSTGSFTPGAAPSVTTLAATSVVAASATLNGNVTSNGVATTVWFEWGTDPLLLNYSSTPTHSAGSGTTAQLISSVLTGLSPEVTYYYRISAINASGTTNGIVADFSTLPLGTLVVSPAGGLTSAGSQGGPFSPSSISYTLSNLGGTSISWTASKGQQWVTLSTTGGTLASGENTTVTVSINSNANSLTVGNYSDTVAFTNTTNGHGSTTRYVTVTVSTANIAPVADAGPDNNALVGSLMTLDGSRSSDADGDPLTYNWSIYSVPGNSSVVTLSGADRVNPTFTPDVEGFYVIQLIVNDGKANSVADSVRITARSHLDPTFGGSGIVTTGISNWPGFDKAYDIDIQPDGKIVAVGESGPSGITDAVMVRYNTDGTVDNTFGTKGIVISAVPAVSKYVAVAIQSDGKIVAAGDQWSTGKIAIARFNVNGSLDTTFGTNGVAITAVEGSLGERSVIIQPDGKILLAGTTSIETDPSYITAFLVIRFNSNGLIDTDFGTSGIVTTQIEGNTNRAQAITLQSNGKIVVAGHYRYISGSYHNAWALARYDSNGILDSTFGSGGKVKTVIGANYNSYYYDDLPYGIAIQSDGKIVAVGGTGGASVPPNGFSDYRFAVVRYNSNGSLDTSFGIGGTQISTIKGFARSVSIQTDGKIVAVGEAMMGPAVLAARYNTDGSPDSTFGTAGQFLIEFDMSFLWATANSVALQPDGKIVAAGYQCTGFNGTNPDFLLIRMVP